MLKPVFAAGPVGGPRPAEPASGASSGSHGTFTPLSTGSFPAISGSHQAATGSFPASSPESGDSLLRDGATVWGRTPQLRAISPNTQLYMQGTPADEAYLIVRGRFLLRRDGMLRRLVLGRYERGDWLAVSELMRDRSYAATAIALEPSMVLPVTREGFERLAAQASPLVLRALTGTASHLLRLLEMYEAQALDQSFLGMCRGVELLIAQYGPMPESQLIARLRELFGLPSASLSEALRLLDGLNLLKRKNEPGREAIIHINEPSTFTERVRSFSEQLHGQLPSLLGEEPPREPMRLDEVCEQLEIPPQQLLRRMMMPDFPVGMLRFDPEAVELFRKTHGDSFFKKRVSGRELLSNLQALEELADVEVSLLKDILPKMELPRLIRLLASVEEGLRDHLLQALSSRVRRTVEQELKYIGAVPSHELADLEAEMLKLCRSA